MFDWIQKWWPRLIGAAETLITFYSNQTQAQGLGLDLGHESSKIQQETKKSDFITIPNPMKNALYTLQILLDLTEISSENQHQLYHGIFLDKQTIQIHNQTPDFVKINNFNEDLSSRLSPCEVVLYFALNSETKFPTMTTTAMKSTSMNQDVLCNLPSFLIHFVGAISDPQTSSVATEFLIKLLQHFKKCLNSHPSEEELLQITSDSEYEWNEYKFQQLKTNVGDLAYHAFFGAFDGIKKILNESTREGIEPKKIPLGNVNLNVLDGEDRENLRTMKVADKQKIRMIETELKSLIWEPLLIDFIYLIQECTTLARIPFTFEIDDENFIVDRSEILENEDLEPLRHRVYEWMNDLESTAPLTTSNNYSGCSLLLDCITTFYSVLSKLLSINDPTDSTRSIKHHLR